MKIYLTPGLGYDERIFERLNFKDYEVFRLKWIEPKRKESILDYSKRLFQSVPNNEDGIVLIGHSLGAVVSQEIAAVKRIEKVILLGSVKSRKEIPFIFKIMKPLKIYKLFTRGLSVNTVFFWGTAHGFTTKEDKDLFKSMLAKNSNNYLQWALKALSGWKTPSIPKETEVIQIHGTNDKTFPLRKIKNPTVVVENGTHIMLYKQAEKLNKIILLHLK